jgi:hypothetical protein
MEAIKEFEGNYRKFVGNHKNFMIGEDEFDSAANRAQREDNMNKSAEVFRTEILKILEVHKQKEQAKEKKVVSKVGNFLIKLYPIAKLSLEVIGALGEVRGKFRLF